MARTKSKQPRKPVRKARRPKVLRPRAIPAAARYCDHCGAPLYGDKGLCLQCCAKCGADLLDGRCPLCDLYEAKRLRAAMAGMFPTPANEATALLLDLAIARMTRETPDDGHG